MDMEEDPIEPQSGHKIEAKREEEASYVESASSCTSLSPLGEPEGLYFCAHCVWHEQQLEDVDLYIMELGYEITRTDLFFSSVLTSPTARGCKD